MTVAAVVLAGGQPAALSDHQQLLVWRGRPLLEHVVDQVRGWPVDERLVVLGHDADQVLESVDLTGCTVLIDLDWELGPMSGLRAALDHLSRRSGPPSAVVVGRGDQPNTQPELVEALILAEGGLAVVPIYRYARGYPVLARRGLWDRLLSAPDDADLLRSLETLSGEVVEVRIDRVPERLVDTDRALALARPDDASERPH